MELINFLFNAISIYINEYDEQIFSTYLYFILLIKLNYKVNILKVFQMFDIQTNNNNYFFFHLK